VKLDRQLRKEWIKAMSERHHEANPPGFYGKRARSRRFLAARVRQAMRQKRSDRKTTQ
jgi:hypothetical protein